MSLKSLSHIRRSVQSNKRYYHLADDRASKALNLNIQESLCQIVWHCGVPLILLPPFRRIAALHNVGHVLRSFHSFQKGMKSHDSHKTSHSAKRHLVGTSI